MSVNSIIPDPQDQTSVDGRVRLLLSAVAAGSSTTLWIYFQVNPTTVGRRAEGVELTDGGRSLVRIGRTTTVFP